MVANCRPKDRKTCVASTGVEKHLLSESLIRHAKIKQEDGREVKIYSQSKHGWRIKADPRNNFSAQIWSLFWASSRSWFNTYFCSAHLHT